MAEEMNNQTNGTEGAENTAQENNQAQGTENTPPAGEVAKTYTQKQLNDLIESRLARERKKYQKTTPVGEDTQEQTPTNTGVEGAPTTVEVSVTEEARQQAAAIIAQANQRLIQAIAQSEATKLNINPDYIADAVRLADLSQVKVNDDGTVDIKSVTTALEAVLTRMPVLKAVSDAPAGGFKVGAQGGNNTQSNGWNGSTSKAGETKRWNRNRY